MKYDKLFHSQQNEEITVLRRRIDQLQSDVELAKQQVQEQTVKLDDTNKQLTHVSTWQYINMCHAEGSCWSTEPNIHAEGSCWKYGVKHVPCLGQFLEYWS